MTVELFDWLRHIAGDDEDPVPVPVRHDPTLFDHSAAVARLLRWHDRDLSPHGR